MHLCLIVEGKRAGCCQSVRAGCYAVVEYLFRSANFNDSRRYGGVNITSLTLVHLEFWFHMPLCATVAC